MWQSTRPGIGGQASPVELLDLSVEPAQVPHAPDALDAAADTEDVRILEHVQLAERRTAEWRGRARRCRELAKVAHEEPA